MQVRQAIVRSPLSRTQEHNEMVSRSADVDDQLSGLLCSLAPARSDLYAPQHQGLSCYPVDDNTFALSRTVVGGLDQGDGGRRVTTQFVIFDRAQLGNYRNNIALVAHVLRSAGQLMIDDSVLNQPANERLPLLDIPDSAFEPLGEFSRVEFANENVRIIDAIQTHGRVVITGLCNPLEFVCSLLASIVVSDRLGISFATGQKVSDERPFKIQFYPNPEADLLKDLADRNIRTFSLGTQPLVRF